MMTWRASQVDDESKDQESHDSNELDGSEAELGFTVNSHGEDVEGENEDDEDSDPGCGSD